MVKMARFTTDFREVSGNLAISGLHFSEKREWLLAFLWKAAVVISDFLLVMQYADW